MPKLAKISMMKKACQVTCDVFTKKLKEDIMEIVDADKVCLSLSALELTNLFTFQVSLAKVQDNKKLCEDCPT